MRPGNIFFSFWLTFFTVSAEANERAAFLAECTPIAMCIEILDLTVPISGLGIYENDVDAIRDILKSRFADAAKIALLEKAISNHAGWRNFAGAILSGWGDWEESDIPILRQALQRNPGSWIAGPLAEIGSQEAIDALIEDLIANGGENQTSFALEEIGPKVLGSLLPVLELPSYTELPDGARDSDGWRDGATIVKAFGAKATIIADEWVAIARNRREPPLRRIAALRGLAAMNGYLGKQSSALRPIQNDRNDAIAKQAYQTLIDVHDPSVARHLAKSCEMNDERWVFSFGAINCLRRLSEFGSNGQIAGDIIEEFLASKNKAEQLYAIETLGLIGYDAAIPKIEPFLSSNDWRHVYAATRALGQLNARQSVSKIEDATKQHWLSELVDFGERTVQLLIRNQPYSMIMGDPWRYIFFGGFGNYSAPYIEDNFCTWATWEYKGAQITFEKPSYRAQKTISLSDGLIIGTNRGEFGGDLTWHPSDGDPIVLVPDNVIDIIEIDGNYISIHGISHLMISYGFAVLITRNENNAFSVEEIARFPAEPSSVKKIDDSLFATNASGRVIVFDRNGIVDAAYCDMSARPTDNN